VPEGSSVPERELSLLCADFRGLEEATQYYLSEVGAGTVTEAAFDVATAVTGDFIKLTNSPWAFSIQQTSRALGLRRLLVINDFTALALSVPLLRPEELRQVGGGSGVSGAPYGLIGAGTGLGVSGLIPSGSAWIPIQGEGGHTAFSPMDEREDTVLKLLRERYGHVSTERLVSGTGLINIYESLCALDHVVPQALKPEQITEAGIAGSDVLCGETLSMFCAALGTASANLVVTLGARGGVYIGGGIVPRLGDYFLHSPFRRRFEHKGRFSKYTAAVPVWVILAENPALSGLAAALNSGFESIS